MTIILIIPGQSQLRIMLTIVIIGYLVVGSLGALTASETHISTSRNADRTSICNYHSSTYSSGDIATSDKYISQYSYLSTSEI